MRTDPSPAAAFAVALAALAAVLTAHPRLAAGETLNANASAVVEGSVDLPCDIEPPNEEDKTVLVLWYKDGSGSPIYSLDLRGQTLDVAPHFSPDDVRSRSAFHTQRRPAVLHIKKVRDEDEGIYRCRVDFKMAPTRNYVVSLAVIVPPKEPSILGEKGLPLNSIVGPYNEGSSFFLSCEAVGGRPPPRVTWWRGPTMLDDSYEVTSLAIVRNDLVVPSLTRADFNAVFTCKASNNNITDPASASITVDMNLKPLEVRIVNTEGALSANRRYDLVCQSSGSRPPPILAWWKGSKKMKRTEETMSLDTNVTTCILSFAPTSDDHGKYLSCRAENPAIPGSGIEDSWKLNVHYAPVVSLLLGSSLKEENIREGDDVYFECNIRSNPWVKKIDWRFQGRTLLHNVTSGVIISNQSLVLQRVRRTSRGIYSCVGINAEGDGESNKVALHVKHIPLCKAGQKTEYGIARNEPAKVVCDVEAYPTQVTFKWAFNRTTEPVEENKVLITHELTRSTLMYTPKTERDYGTFFCWGSNEMGMQQAPCAFILTPAGPPDPTHNCTVYNQTESGFEVECIAGYDGGLQQEFVAELTNTLSQEVILTRKNPRPVFQMTNLPSGSNFFVYVYASNAKGRSDSYMTLGVTSKAQDAHSGSDSWFTTILAVVIGVVVALALLGITIIIVIRLRSSQRSKRKEYEPQNADRSHVPLRRDTDDAVDAEEKSPDVIPSSNDQDFPLVKVKCLQPKWAYSKEGPCDSCCRQGANSFHGGGGGTLPHDSHNSYRYQIRKIMPYDDSAPIEVAPSLALQRPRLPASARWVLPEVPSSDALHVQTYQEGPPPPPRGCSQTPVEEDNSTAETPLMNPQHESTV